MPRRYRAGGWPGATSTGHGPATLQDLCGWSGITAADARAGLEPVKPELAEETVDGKTCWLPPDLPEAQDAAAGELPRVDLLPGFDEYLLGYRDRGARSTRSTRRKSSPARNGIFKPIVVISGRVAGLWKRTLKRTSVAVSAHPFQAFTKGEERAIAVQAEPYGEFIGLPVA